MRITSAPVGFATAGFILLAAVVAACSPEDVVNNPDLCGFDGDASPGYQEVELDLTPHDGTVAGTHQAAAGSTNAIDAYVRANLLEGASLCNIGVTFEVTAGGGHLSSATATTGTTLVGADYLATVQWTLGAPGPQTLHAYVTSDPTIETTVTLTATGAVPTNTVYLYNGVEIDGVGIPEYLVGPGEATTAGGLIAPHAERSLAISTTVGSTDLFRAYNVGNTLIASITCQVTATAWTGGGQPLVVLEFNVELNHYAMSCSEGLSPAP